MFVFLLVVIDCFSKYMFVEPLKLKSADHVIEAFGKIFARTTRRPQRLQSDKGLEFTGSKFKKFMKTNGIPHNTTSNPETKASICERSIRTLKGRIFKYLTYNNTLSFIDQLQNFVKAYNDSYHSTIKMAPSAVNDRNVLQVYENIKASQMKNKRKNKKIKRQDTDIKVGDYVRMSKEKKTFRKGYLKNYTEEVFRVKAVIQRTPVVFRLVDLAGEDITGIFYKPEIQKINFDETAVKVIFKIIKQRGRGKNLQYLVRWAGYSPAFDSWVAAKSITTK